MAIENQVILNGQIRTIRKAKKDSETVQVTIGLMVIRRPKTVTGNRAGDLRSDVVLVLVREKRLIEYLEERKAAVGDMLEVSGVYCTLHGMKTFHCKHCGMKNSFEGTISFVNPLCLRLDEIHPKRMETVSLTELERHSDKEEIMEILKERKSFPGEILAIEDLGPTKDGSYRIRLTVREKISDGDLIKWLRWMGEISNRIYIMGNVCADPSYNPIDNGGRVCTYQLGINRKVFIREDDPSVRADFPWVKSLGDQADKDRDALMKGSLVFIDGSIQARDDFLMDKKCENCGEITKVKGQAMEIIPYSVEYLRNCITSSDEDEDEFEDDEFEETTPGTGVEDEDDDYYEDEERDDDESQRKKYEEDDEFDEDEDF